MKKAHLMLLLAAAFIGCGSQSSNDDGDRPAAAGARASLNGADKPRVDQFPKAQEGASLQELASRIGGRQVNVGTATSVFTAGRNRFAFGVLDRDNRFIYAPSAIYVAPSFTSADVVGPLPAPADLLITEPAFRSRQAASEGDSFSAVYSVDGVRFEKPGTWAILVVSLVDGKPAIGRSAAKVVKDSPVPEPGEKAPVVETDTVESARGDIASIDTRLPPSDMHERSLADVIGRKPVALLFSTPQMCQSRVCGPVVDIALQLKEKYGDRVEFIHQEVYVENNPQKGLRKPLQAYGLPTEPWLFTIGEDGKVAARLEGSFGLKAFERALRVAIARG